MPVRMLRMDTMNGVRSFHVYNAGTTGCEPIFILTTQRGVPVSSDERNRAG